MPPKGKDAAAKKPAANVVRPAISSSSLLWTPSDPVEGYQERIHRCVDWSLIGQSIRHHREMCNRDEIPPMSFSKALENKMNHSFLRGVFDENSTLSLQEHWEITIPIEVWNYQKAITNEERVDFIRKNNLTDDLLTLAKKAVKFNDREVLKKGLKKALVLRIIDAEMTYLDNGLKQFPHLTCLNLCGNYLDQIDCKLLPRQLRSLELQANRFSNADTFVHLHPGLLYLGLAKNTFTDENLQGLGNLPHSLTVLDLSDNDIYHLEPLLDVLVQLRNLTSLHLAGNPCSCCCAYAMTTVSRLQRLRWLDNRQVLRSDRSADIPFEPHNDDLRSAWFNFTIIRIISPPMPPRVEKGSVATFHVEFELPLIDRSRRCFLMFRRFESLEEMFPPPEDEIMGSEHSSGVHENKSSTNIEEEASSKETDIFEKLEPQNPYLICHYEVFESNRVSWNKVLSFQEPTIKLFCPDLTALRDTFRSTITLRFIYSLSVPKKVEKKPTGPPPPSSRQAPTDFRVTIATIKCTLQNPDWSQPAQHFHWDDSLGTTQAIHWGEGDLTAVQYTQAEKTKSEKKVAPKAGKEESKIEKVLYPENLTCHFAFGIETLRG